MLAGQVAHTFGDEAEEPPRGFAGSTLSGETNTSVQDLQALHVIDLFKWAGLHVPSGVLRAMAQGTICGNTIRSSVVAQEAATNLGLPPPFLHSPHLAWPRRLVACQCPHSLETRRLLFSCGRTDNWC